MRGGPIAYRAEVTIGLALFSALLYGCADFFGGLASRRTRATTVVVVSQLAGVVVLAIAWRFVPGRFEASDVWYGIAGGVGGGLAIAALYAALATGRMGIVSPVAAVIGATVPVIWVSLQASDPRRPRRLASHAPSSPSVSSRRTAARASPCANRGSRSRCSRGSGSACSTSRLPRVIANRDSGGSRSYARPRSSYSPRMRFSDASRCGPHAGRYA